MRLPEFEYFAPGTLEETRSLLTSHKGEAKVVAGGTDLLVKMKNRRTIPPYLVSIRNIPDLDYIVFSEEDGLRLGAMTSLEVIKNSSVIADKFEILAQAAGRVGSVAIRNQGTIGGNICNAAPSAETAPALIVLGAKAIIIGAEGEKQIAMEDFFTGPGKTVLDSDDILTGIQIPVPLPCSGGVYLKYGTRQLDIAVVGVAVIVRMENNICADIRIALGAVAPTPIRAAKAEDVIRKKEPAAGLVKKAAELASQESQPISDIRGRAENRRKMVAVLTAQAIEEAVLKAGNGDN